MAVMTLRRLAAVAVWLPAVSAGLEREKPNPWAPIETPGPKPEAEINLAPAAVTARPAMRALIQKRNENTCGYMAGDLSECKPCMLIILEHDPDLFTAAGYVCAASSAVCLYNTQSSAVGCCLPTGCNIYTACLPYESSDATKTLDMDRTRYWYAHPAPPRLARKLTTRQLRLDEALLCPAVIYRPDLHGLYHPVLRLRRDDARHLV